MKNAQKYREEEQLDIERRLRVLANAVIDKVLKMTPEEREELNKKIMKDKSHAKK